VLLIKPFTTTVFACEFLAAVPMLHFFRSILPHTQQIFMSAFLCAPGSQDSAGKTAEKSLLLPSSWNSDLKREPNNKLKSQIRIC
jgi:hypothetical protein